MTLYEGFGSLFSSLAGRCCPFGGPDEEVDAAVFCHELRCVDHAQGETFLVSLGDVMYPQGEEFATLGELVRMRALRVDSVLLLRAWAVGNVPCRRACGELRIPMSRLSTRCHGVLFHTWLTLESAGLSDSFAATEASEAFDHALVNGPRQLFQPKVCVTICKVSDLGHTGEAIWGVDEPEDARVMRWGALVQSHEQHVLMSAAQHLHLAQLQAEKSGPHIDTLEAQAQSQTQELDELRTALEIARQSESSRAADEQVRADAADAASADEREAELELELLRSELAKVTEEANITIDSANERISMLRAARDSMVDQASHLNALGHDLYSERNDAVFRCTGQDEQHQEVTKQMEELVKIVKELRQTCTDNDIMPSSHAQLLMEMVPDLGEW
eukprot:NODE_7333_length_1589_cov_3.074555.p1 GENE.NODE_7333_length_1589_cov_3.074555~~NODE_7333_length_1589_cov_3.074555.p1  ORF type:complete len:389 (-),score=104.46 NODE_7333_length_1589_cov_3.074555:312-1478(-)